MGSAWLAISGPDPTGRAALFEAAARWLPFAGAAQHRVGDQHPDTELRAWTIADEVTAGPAFVGDVEAHGAPIEQALAFDGWIVPPVQGGNSRAEQVLGLIGRDGVEAAAALDGQFSWCLWRDGQATAAGGFLQGLHVYKAEKSGVFALSNRAMMAAAAVHGDLPEPAPLHLGWLLTGVACPFGNRSCWPNVSLLEDGAIASIGRDGLKTRRWLPRQPTPGPPNWAHEAEALAIRTASVATLPGAFVQMALTGGKDSRLVLAAAKRADVIDAIDRFYLKAVPEHPDAKVARLLADYVDRDVALIDPPQARMDIFDAARAHLFCAEVALGPWDHKAGTTRERVVGVHGNFGEIYKSHVRPSFLLGWPVARRFYAGKWLNPNGLLRPSAVAHYKDVFREWLTLCQDEGTPLSDLHDRWHREARMGRWLGQTLQFDACGVPAINPIPSRSLLRAYLSLPWRDRRDHKLHFELMRHLDEELFLLPFANDRWKPRMLERRHPRATPITGNVLQVSPQFALWERQKSAICAYLREKSGADAFFELVDAKALARHLERAKAKPSWRRLEPIYALIGIKLAVTEGVSPAPFTIA